MIDKTYVNVQSCTTVMGIEMGSETAFCSSWEWNNPRDPYIAIIALAQDTTCFKYGSILDLKKKCLLEYILTWYILGPGGQMEDPDNSFVVFPLIFHYNLWANFWIWHDLELKFLFISCWLLSKMVILHNVDT